MYRIGDFTLIMNSIDSKAIEEYIKSEIKRDSSNPSTIKIGQSQSLIPKRTSDRNIIPNEYRASIIRIEEMPFDEYKNIKSRIAASLI